MHAIFCGYMNAAAPQIAGYRLCSGPMRACLHQEHSFMSRLHASMLALRSCRLVPCVRSSMSTTYSTDPQRNIISTTIHTNEFTELVYCLLPSAVSHLGAQAAWALKSKAAMLLAAVIRQQGPDTYTAILPQLIGSAAEGPLQAELACMVLQFVSEDLTQFEQRGGDWKRNFLSALLASVDTVLPFVVKVSIGWHCAAQYCLAYKVCGCHEAWQAQS